MIFILGFLIAFHAIDLFLRYRKNGKYLISGHAMIFLGVLVFGFASSLSFEGGNSAYSYSDGEIMDGYMTIIVGYVVYLYSYSLAINRSKNKLSKNHEVNKENAMMSFGYGGISWYAVAVTSLALMLASQVTFEDMSFEKLHPLLPVVALISFAGIIYSFTSPLFLIYFFIALLWSSFEMLFLWSRRPLAGSSLSMLFFLLLVKTTDGGGMSRLVKKAVIPIAITVSLGCFLFISVFRDQLFIKQAQLADVIQGASAEGVLGDIENMARAGEGLDAFELTVFSRRVYPEQLPYVYFNSIWALLVNPIPRAAWSEKPEGHGLVLARSYLGTNNPWYNVGPGFFGEAWANGGYFALVVFSLLLAIFIALVDTYYMESGLMLWQHIPYVAMAPLVPFIIRGDLLNSAYSIVFSFFVSWACIWIAARTARVRS